MESQTPNWTHLLCSIIDEAARGVQSELKMLYLVDATPRTLSGEGSRRFRGITGEAQRNWFGGQ